MWKRRIHKCVHRIAGGSLALIALLNELKAVDLTQFMTQEHATFALACFALGIVGLEFLPILGSWLDGEESGDNSVEQK